MLDEVAAPVSADVLRAYRCILAWCRGEPDEAVAIRRAASAEWLHGVRAARYSRDVADPLRFIAGELARLHPRAPGLARACNRMSAWALRVRAERTALLFTEAAALAEPADARAAWRAGRMLRDFGYPFEAEAWLRRAIRIATWQHDVETQNLALNSLGNLFCQQGRYRAAELYLRRALRVASSADRRRRGAVSHDLLLVFLATGKYAAAEQMAASAVKFYGKDDLILPKLAHDTTLLWMRQGKFSIALPVLRRLLPLLRASHERLRILASIVRAAGALRETEEFESGWREASLLLDDDTPDAKRFLPEALADLGAGAVSMGALGVG